MLGIERVDASQNKIIDKAAHAILNFLHFVFLCFRGIGLSSAKNREERVFAKVLGCIENPWIGEVDLRHRDKCNGQTCENESIVLMPDTLCRLTIA